VEVGEYKEYVYAADVHVEYLYTEPGIVEHLFPELDDEARFRDIVSP